MGHKVSDGLSIVVVNDSGGDLKHGDGAAISGVFGFCDTDAADGEEVSLSIGQEEREVPRSLMDGGWVEGDPVYFNPSVGLFQVSAAVDPFDTPVGVASRSTHSNDVAGWMIVIPGAFAGRA